MIIPLGPSSTNAEAVGIVGSLLSATTQPVAEKLSPNRVQSPVSPKKKKSTPLLILGLKNSVHPEQTSVATVESWEDEIRGGFMIAPLNPNVYCHGLVLVAPVPQSVTTPVVGSL